MIARVTLNNSRQDRDEAIRSYCARLRGQANVCKYVIDCQNCEHQVDYTESILCDVICRGLEDSDIQLDLLGQTNQDISLRQERQARGQQPNSSNNMRAMLYAAHTRSHNLKMLLPCTYCGKKGHETKSVAKRRETQCPAFNHVCTHCNRPHHYKSVCRSKDKPANPRKQNQVENQGAVFDEFDQEADSHGLCAIQQTKKANQSSRLRQDLQKLEEASVKSSAILRLVHFNRR